MKDFMTAVGAVVIAIGLGLFVAAISALPVWIAWNAIMPQLFGLSEISFIGAFWLSLLSSCLFKPSVPSKSDIKDAIKEAR